ncbi:L-seryl-tRNA(Sec) selenium transferase [Solirubrobacter ginsenosidimutans]|uniref:L-seryl-tRNA(Sec) selenium transferase n=1 Tax=Solirubrobacter ginsenosidimutans TaxID=490573 RepID=A0A9X3N6R8_9ACTN|nr:L-seryl-tRNA(Sec) selenium transferase [Solirubrobacter ginsenosidimutans]MDA0165878.1 L-seryl-tRNA(Sec) selenium transferase [Solirubrobacter ginsenosidimutans]
MSALRGLPPVDTLAAEVDAPRALAVAAARAVLAERRAELLGGALGETDLGARARAWAADVTRPSLRRVLNATGVIIHTNLGRAPLAAAAREAVARAAEGYGNLELDLVTGERGSRHIHVEALLCALTGAEAGFAVNNGAGAALLATAALAGVGREVIVSRGQLVEIGGGFRVPDVIAQAGARLVEVGTTNRTRVDDYSRAVTADTAAILRVHQSNFRQLGFVEDVGVEALCELGVPVIDDVGSGALDALYDEPAVRRSVAAGAALVCFSGDKLLGGPQAGLLVGRAEAVERAKRHPLARALRIDKLSLAALEATLRLHRDAPDEIPVLAMLHASREVLLTRAERLAAALPGAEIIESVARVGGGALPLLELPGPVVALPDASLAPALRAGDPPLIGRVEHARLLLDPRTLADDELEATIAAVKPHLRGQTP